MARRGQEDAYYHQAKKDGYVARSVYKLQEMDKRYQLLRRGMKVLDLGCHPGSWLQYASDRVGPKGLVVGVDIQPLKLTLPGNARFIEADLLDFNHQALKEFAPAFDAVISDAAPHTTGIRHADAARSLELSGRSVELGCSVLKKGGILVCKVYQGAGMEDLVRRVKQGFKMGKTYTPTVTTKGSREMFLVGKGFKG